MSIFILRVSMKINNSNKDIVLCKRTIQFYQPINYSWYYYYCSYTNMDGMFFTIFFASVVLLSSGFITCRLF